MSEGSLPGRVVVGVGRSLGAYQALRYAVVEARRRHTDLLAVRAYRSTGYGQSPLPADCVAGAARDVVEVAFAEALGGLPPDLPLKIIVRDGHPARTLVATADRESDLIVIGGCGTRRLTRPRSTAIARFCAREAGCPVIIIPPNALARAARAERLARDAAGDAQDFLLRQMPPGTQLG
jgi:nucleotide-binding universal stress UspA family protein